MKFRCPYCKAEFSGNPEAHGKPPSTCPACGKSMAIPTSCIPGRVLKAPESERDPASPRDPARRKSPRTRPLREKLGNEPRMTGALPVIVLAQRGTWFALPVGAAVVLVLGLAVSRPGVLGPGLAAMARTNLNTVAIRELNNLRMALEFFHSDCDRYPSTEEGLLALIRPPGDRAWNGPYVNLIRPDPWGHHYAYACEGDAIRLLSRGPDGKEQTPDDLHASADAAKPGPRPEAAPSPGQREAP